MKRLGIWGMFSALAVVAAILVLIGTAVPALAGGTSKYSGNTGGSSYQTPKLQLGGIYGKSGPQKTQRRYGSGSGTGANTRFNTPYQPDPPKTQAQPTMSPGQKSLAVEKREELNIMIPKPEEK